MKTVPEIAEAMVIAARINKRARELEMIDMVLKAKPSNISKRDALGLNRHHKQGSTPLFEEQKSLF